MTDPRAVKTVLRQQALEGLRAVTPTQRKEFDAQILQRVQEWPGWKALHTLFAYASDADEPDTRGLIQAALRDAKKVGLPRVERKTKRMRVLEIKNLQSDLEPGYAGLLEPKNELSELAAVQLDAVILPGRAFDVRGNRLGRGAGHYDRWLAKAALKKEIVLMAVAYESQLVAQLPVEAHDIPVQWIFTEKRIIDTRA